MIPLEKLLEPLSTEKPSGEDPDRSGSLFTLRQLIKTEVGAEEETERDWTKVQTTALDILEGCRDLRVAVILALALLKKEGLPGFRDGLLLLRGFVEKFWDSVFPLLDPEELTEDPTRANALRNLSPDLGKEGDYRFITYLRQVPLTFSQRLGSYCLRDILRAEGKVVADAKEKPVALAQIEAAFRDSSQTSGKSLQDAHTQIKELLGLLDALEAAYAAKCQEGVTPSFETLRGTVQEMEEWVRRHVQVANTEKSSVQPPEGTTAAAAPNATPPSWSPSGSIASPEDVKTALRAVCDYYKERDRSSPVPFFMERALRLLDKDFMQSVGDLAPESLKELNKLFGLAPQPQSPEKK